MQINLANFGREGEGQKKCNHVQKSLKCSEKSSSFLWETQRGWADDHRGLITGSGVGQPMMSDWPRRAKDKHQQFRTIFKNSCYKIDFTESGGMCPRQKTLSSYERLVERWKGGGFLKGKKKEKGGQRKTPRGNKIEENRILDFLLCQQRLSSQLHNWRNHVAYLVVHSFAVWTYFRQSFL